MSINIDKKEFFGEDENDNFADNFDRAFSDTSDEDLEKIFMEDLPDLPDELGNDGYKDVLSSLSELDPTGHMDVDYLAANRTRTLNFGSDKTEPSKKKHFSMPNLLKPFWKTLKFGGKFTAKTLNFLCRAATLLLIAAILVVLSFAFANDYKTYGTLSTALATHNYTLAAYFSVALVLILFEVITFLLVLFTSKRNRSRKNKDSVDSGRGLVSFILIFSGALASNLFARYIPVTPSPLIGLQGALVTYSSLLRPLAVLSGLGVLSCLIRRFFLR